MKKIITLLLVLQSFLVVGQTEKTSTLPTPESKTFVWKNGEGTYVDVNFSYLVPEEINIEKKILDKVVMNIMVKSKYKLKNKYSFVPKKLTILYSEKDGTYSGISKYIGKNSYGVESESTTYWSFDLEGEIKEIMTL